MTTAQGVDEEIETVNNPVAEEIAELERNLARRITHRDACETEAERAEREVTEFKRRVVRAARNGKSRYSWCPTVDDAMGELDLEFPRLTFTGQVNFRVAFTATDTDRVDVDNNMPANRGVQHSLEGLEAIASSIRETLSMDENRYSGFAVTNVSFDVENLVRIPSEE